MQSGNTWTLTPAHLAGRRRSWKNWTISATNWKPRSVPERDSGSLWSCENRRTPFASHSIHNYRHFHLLRATDDLHLGGLADLQLTKDAFVVLHVVNWLIVDGDNQVTSFYRNAARVVSHPLKSGLRRSPAGVHPVDHHPMVVACLPESAFIVKLHAEVGTQ